MHRHWEVSAGSASFGRGVVLLGGHEGWVTGMWFVGWCEVSSSSKIAIAKARLSGVDSGTGLFGSSGAGAHCSGTTSV